MVETTGIEPESEGAKVHAPNHRRPHLKRENARYQLSLISGVSIQTIRCTRCTSIYSVFIFSSKDHL
jgi:hypothetical protein